MYRTFKRLLFRYEKRAFNEQKKHVLEQLGEREWELRNDWLFNSTNYLSFTNKKKNLDQKKEVLARQAKNIGLSICSLGVIPFISLLVNYSRKTATSTQELMSIDSKKREIQRAKDYFQKIKDNEEDYEKNKSKELEPWTEEIVTYSLASMPFSKYDEIVEKRDNDPYLKFLHIYSIFLATLFTGGLIVFYFIYKKSRDPRYRFLDSGLSKHVIEGVKFEKQLTDLIRKKYEFDSAHNLNYCLTNSFNDIALSSAIHTKFIRKPALRTFFFIFLSLITGGIFSVYLHWLSLKNSGEEFNKWWAQRRVKAKEEIEALGNVSRTWWGRGIRFIRTLWSDLYIISRIAANANWVISTIFLKPFIGIKRFSSYLFVKTDSPSVKKSIIIFLVLFTSAFLLIGCTLYQGEGFSSWPTYPTVFGGSLLILWGAYLTIFRQLWMKGVKFLGKAWEGLIFIPYDFNSIKKSTANIRINTSFFKPSRSIKNLNWAFFWMFSSPLSKWLINVFLLLVSYALLLVWSFMYKFGVNDWPFYTLIATSTLFLLLLGYHIYLVI